MIGAEALAITYGLSCAVTWGAGDFSGGFATKRGNVLSVVLISQMIGLLLLVLLAVSFAEPVPALSHMTWGSIGGIFGALGLLTFYPALANGMMSIIAPISAIVTAVVPIGFAFFLEGLPGSVQLAGFSVALVAVWALSSQSTSGNIKKRELVQALIAGMGFGLFFVCIDRASEGGIFWPLVSARVASISLIALLIVINRKPMFPGHQGILFIALAGILDSLGNAFFALAAQQGRLDVAAVLGSLYPVSTVILAGMILKERLQPRQWFGVIAAASALVLIAM